ncbi:tol-pal system protein YbgF [Rhodalgimonas zhirmunskyi]|uniref:Cell division coordinator CpoB n=1 Tax=Rhodalgimonas zhirmunskyi TaxID=2964767 RepID=A0AAJ1U8U2_9RHOB|nr:tol-pal system protein YbgF [Rhodoalgimonas zhirmunskyi]MDQ2095084.1 tol-pal system protein YbgF [Rhodoalgimonas zhirmunskyi]
MRLFFGVFLSVVLVAGLPATAQDKAQTLADIRQQLTVLHVEIQKLKRELSTTGGATTISGGSVLDRVGAIETELSRLTSKTEQLEMRINAVVKDGTNRVADLEFRLVEQEGGDVSKLGETTTLGGEIGAGDGTAAALQVTPESGQVQSGPELALGEKADFEAAQAALDQGEAASAAEKFAAFNQTYPGSPLAPAANLGRGKALDATGDTTGSARAFLETFQLDPTGPQAPEALYFLGRALGKLGQTKEACVTLAEVGVRFPGGDPAAKASEERTRLGCQ